MSTPVSLVLVIACYTHVAVIEDVLHTAWNGTNQCTHHGHITDTD